MGCGKTTMGKALSSIYNMDFLDLDKYICLNENMPVKDIFEKKGEAYFRQKEFEACIYASCFSNTIVATGGGVVTNYNNIVNLKKSGLIIYLKADAKTIERNLKADNTRPLLINKNKTKEIESLLNERRALYEKYSDFIIDINNLTNPTVENLSLTFGKILNKI